MQNNRENPFFFIKKNANKIKFLFTQKRFKIKTSKKKKKNYFNLELMIA